MEYFSVDRHVIIQCKLIVSNCDTLRHCPLTIKIIYIYIFVCFDAHIQHTHTNTLQSHTKETHINTADFNLAETYSNMSLLQITKQTKKPNKQNILTNYNRCKTSFHMRKKCNKQNTNFSQLCHIY